jgi:AcrR family transcriptional regulator
MKGTASAAGTPPWSKVRPTMDPLSTQERLLNAATQVFLAHGFAGASMEMVRQLAGVSNGSLYHHFPTKAKLADVLYTYTLSDFHAALLPCIGERTAAEAGVRGMLRAYVGWVLAHPDRARLLHELRRSGHLSDEGEWAKASEENFRVLSDWVSRKVAEGQMRKMPFPIWVALVFAPAISLTAHWVKQPDPSVPPAVRSALERAAWLAVSPDD